jgi:hypothetical protein
MFFRRARGFMRREACFAAACSATGQPAWERSCLARGLQSYSAVVETKPAAALRHPRRKASACDEAPPFVNYNKEQK